MRLEKCPFCAGRTPRNRLTCDHCGKEIPGHKKPPPPHEARANKRAVLGALAVFLFGMWAILVPRAIVEKTGHFTPGYEITAEQAKLKQEKGQPITAEEEKAIQINREMTIEGGSWESAFAVQAAQHGIFFLLLPSLGLLAYLIATKKG